MAYISFTPYTMPCHTRPDEAIPKQALRFAYASPTLRLRFRAYLAHTLTRSHYELYIQLKSNVGLIVISVRTTATFGGQCSQIVYFVENMRMLDVNGYRGINVIFIYTRIHVCFSTYLTKMIQHHDGITMNTRTCTLIFPSTSVSAGFTSTPSNCCGCG